MGVRDLWVGMIGYIMEKILGIQTMKSVKNTNNQDNQQCIRLNNLRKSVETQALMQSLLTLARNRDRSKVGESQAQQQTTCLLEISIK